MDWCQCSYYWLDGALFSSPIDYLVACKGLGKQTRYSLVGLSSQIQTRICYTRTSAQALVNIEMFVLPK